MSLPRRDLLVAVSGLTPQVITETLYALCVLEKKPVPIREVFVLTTSTGRDLGIKALLEGQKHFHRFCRDYGLTGIRFTPKHFIVLGGGEALGDIRSKTENSLIADQVVSFIRDLARDENVALHGSIAGGRKTMGVYLALAFQLFGREQDRLYHVLVNAEFESCQDFYYPPPRNRRIAVTARDGAKRYLNTRDARIELATIPFVRVRRITDVPDDLYYEKIVSHVQDEVDACPRKSLTVDYARKCVIVGETRIPLKPVQLALYGLFLDRKKACRLALNCHDCSRCYLSMHEGFFTAGVQTLLLGEYRKVCGGETGRYDNLAESIHAKQADFFVEHISRINGALKKHLSANDYALAKIRNIQEDRREGRYGILQDKGLIR